MRAFGIGVNLVATELSHIEITAEFAEVASPTRLIVGPQNYPCLAHKLKEKLKNSEKGPVGLGRAQIEIAVFRRVRREVSV